MSEQLTDAVMLDDLAEAKRLTAAGADVNCDGGFPVFLAVLNNNADMLEFLLEKGGCCEDLGIKQRVAKGEA